MYSIYKITSPSKKSYIGQTWNMKERMKGHQKPRSNCILLKRAIQKYRWKNMHVKVLWLCEENEAGHYEQLMIKQFETLAPHGYNCTTGGEINKRLSEETKYKIASTLRACSNERCERIIESYLYGNLQKDIALQERLGLRTIYSICTLKNNYSHLLKTLDNVIIQKLYLKSWKKKIKPIQREMKRVTREVMSPKNKNYAKIHQKRMKIVLKEIIDKHTQTEAIRMYCNGKTIAEIGTLLNCGCLAVSNMIHCKGRYAGLNTHIDLQLILEKNNTNFIKLKPITIPTYPGDIIATLQKLSRRLKVNKCNLRKKMRNNKKIRKKSVDHIRNLEKILLEHGIKLPKRNSEDIYNYPLTV